MTTRTTRSDAYAFMTSSSSRLPDHFRDNGCELAPKCLECPFPVCKYDAPARGRPGRPAGSVTIRDRDIVLLRTRYGVKAEIIAEHFGLSRRAVFRIVAAQYEAHVRGGDAAASPTVGIMAAHGGEHHVYPQPHRRRR